MATPRTVQDTDRPAAPRPGASPRPGAIPRPVRDGDAAVRLRLVPADSEPGLLDGAWWPRSRDLARELPALLTVLDPLLGRMTHATVHRASWPDIPARIPMPTHIMRVGWYDAEQDPDTLCLLSYTVGRWDLLVVPPEAAPDAAAAAMAAASTAGNHRSASALIDEFRDGTGQTG